MNSQSIKEKLKLFNINPEKKLGQNFLIEQNILKKITNFLKSILTDDVCIVEIGGGIGNLSEEIVNTLIPQSYITIEKDPFLAELLKTKFNEKSNVKIIEMDVLDYSFEDIAKSKKLFIVGNIPYYITSEILVKVLPLAKFDNYKGALFLVQKEVAQRLKAKTGTKEYGKLTILCQLYSQPSILFNVSRSCFYPCPKVDSSFIYLPSSRKLANNISINELKPVIDKLFSNRRKKISNSLDVDSNQKDRLIKSGIDLNKRGDQLTLDEIILIVKLLSR